jgi:hypothetical protein
MASAIVSVEYKAERKIGSGLPVGGAYVETWIRGEREGVENRDSRQARVEVEGYKASAARNGAAHCVVTEDSYTGRIVVDLPGALDLRYVYFLPV